MKEKLGNTDFFFLRKNCTFFSFFVFTKLLKTLLDVQKTGSSKKPQEVSVEQPQWLLLQTPGIAQKGAFVLYDTYIFTVIPLPVRKLRHKIQTTMRLLAEVALNMCVCLVPSAEVIRVLQSCFCPQGS